MLFAAILARVDTSDDSAKDQTYLAYLLMLFVVPGYVNMAWQCVKAYLDLMYEALDEAAKAKDKVKDLDTSWCGCILKSSRSAASKSAVPRQLELTAITGLAPRAVEPLKEAPRSRESAKPLSAAFQQTSFNPIHDHDQGGGISIKTDTFNPDASGCAEVI